METRSGWLRLRRTEKQAANGTNGTLVQDPKTGEYRLAKD
ncbi:membrane protein [Mesorhizobium sp. LSJC255A00]|nr:membrane protein [Mesorhizobium sp. LSJC255A00]